ncbi:3-dehydroquinate dehydratase-2 [Rhodobium orientis]|uniref:3-dehydroquinate dehydratase n=1 Tax=Rhodobium orientis TaxID=34017 RepID=A0A327K148_9HYPH|nr:type II 3-dehydroquinate dehydratase [Rhodobium orientis]MBB4302640.1 3-dehydroquinate dehydratase-2 [Rhodobium orientis]MBK5951490.1 type II 3-dehydroquinate dehydratase [Rhodobium orientis]RAI29088.1 type II 3-dehydroquinate dehydratase [Rhodobium orientis]
MAISIYILNGPNLNRLGTREPEIYGSTTLADIEAECARRGDALGMEIDFRQSNHEGMLVDWIHEAGDAAKGLIINPGAYSHTSIALHDAIQSVTLPVIEVHISNIFARESFRHHSYVSPVARGVICGMGTLGYGLALEALAGMVGGARSS